jgi:cell division protein FtsL
MSVVAERARVTAPAQRTPPREEPRSRQRPRRQARVASGAVWIVLVAGLLAGVVAMTVTVLRLNLRLDSLGRERAKLRADNAQLFSQLSSAAASSRIQSLAAHEFGLVPAQPDQTAYLNLRGR